MLLKFNTATAKPDIFAELLYVIVFPAFPGYQEIFHKRYTVNQIQWQIKMYMTLKPEVVITLEKLMKNPVN